MCLCAPCHLFAAIEAHFPREILRTTAARGHGDPDDRAVFFFVVNRKSATGPTAKRPDALAATDYPRRLKHPNAAFVSSAPPEFC